jgi:prepilin-type N-terminal cleavage/methylation domain-containing protein
MVWTSGSSSRGVVVVRVAGFTLVELLVVIAIIGILVALLLPAVQAAREASRRTSCVNNMKNIALGLHHYHDAHKKFPPGYITAGVSRLESWGWPVFILPFVEQQSLYDALQVDDRRLTDLLQAGTDIPLLQTHLPLYRCPSDLTSRLLPQNPRHFHGINAPTTFEPSASNYMGNRGFFDSGGAFKNNGILFGNSRITLAEVTDGTSSTFLLGEREERCSAGTWIGSRNPPGSGPWGAYMILFRVSMKFNDPSSGGHDTCMEGLSSKHPGGGNFALCDASVRFVSENIEFTNGGNSLTNLNALDVTTLGTYQLLGSRNDGQPIPNY